MDILEEFLEIARKELGVKEFKNGNNPRILEYDATTTLAAKQDYVPWCSSFVNWVVKQAGVKGTNSAAARSWLNWGEVIQNPIPGCITIFQRGKNKDLGHVAFFLEETPNFIKVLGGNQDNEVNESNFWKTSLLGYRIPKK